jgi:hypothetical protein
VIREVNLAGAHNPAVPYCPQIQHLEIRLMPFFCDVAACACEQLVRLSIARGEAMLFDDHRVPPPYVDAGALIYRRRVRNFPLSIRGIGIDRKLRWTGFGPFGGPGQLLNGTELETRVEGWLKAAGLPRTACGHWYFTWNAFRIECDPQSVLKTVQAFDLRSVDVREGAAYQESDVRGSGTLARKAGGLDSAIFSVEMPVDPDAFRRVRAESDVVVGEIMKKPVSLDGALVDGQRRSFPARFRSHLTRIPLETCVAERR